MKQDDDRAPMGTAEGIVRRQNADEESAVPFREKLEHFLQLTSGFWRTRHARWAWPLLAVNVTAQFTAVYVSILSTQYSKALWDMLGDRAIERLPGILGLLAVVVVATVLEAIVSTLTRETIAFQWRQWLTERYTARWMESGSYYRSQLYKSVDNPDQRIAEDTGDFAKSFVSMALALVYVTSMGVTFGVILWKASGSGELSLGFTTVYLPGYLLILTTLYTILQTFGVMYVGRKLPRLALLGQRFGADFRFKLIQVRRSAEQIALLRGERVEQETLRERFASIRSNFYGQIFQQIKILTFNASLGAVHDLFPLMLTLPSYVVGRTTLGDMMQTQRSMGQYSSTISYFSQAATSIQVLRGTIRRLRSFDMIMNNVPPGFEAAHSGQNTCVIRVENLRLAKPDGTPLLYLRDWQVEAGERWLIRGASGVGKSTFLRALAGIWPATEGRLAMPPAHAALFLPQQPYLPVGTLRHAITYPSRNPIADAELRRLLALVGLDSRADDLDVSAEWDQKLSPGEQQRLAFLRPLLRRPRLVLLDEATSALDPTNARAMYQLLLETLPDVTIISIAHTDRLDDLHTHQLMFAEHGANVRSFGLDVQSRRA